MDLAVVFASLVVTQLIITMGVLGVIAARAWIGRASDANDQATRPRADRRHAGLGPLRSSHGRREPAIPAIEAPREAPRSLKVPVMALARVPLSSPRSNPTKFRMQPTEAWAQHLATTPPLVSLPVTSLAGLPISRPVLEGWSGRRKRGKKSAALRRAVQQVVSARCSGCEENRALGRDYCVACMRRLTPFLT
jgi:hypothetical protein